MSKDIDVKQLIINQLTKEQYNSLKDNNQLSNTELYIITDDKHLTDEELIEILKTKQDKLTTSGVLSIDENNILSIDLTDYYTKTETDNLLNDKANKSETGYSIEYIGTDLILKDKDGNTLSTAKITSNPEVDKISISYNKDNNLQSIGEITKRETPKYTWIGTTAEYEQALQDGNIIDEYTEILITDSSAETVTPIAEIDIPTKLSELANDTNFVTQNDIQNLTQKIEDLENNIPDDTNIVHKTGNEHISGFKSFSETITIKNGSTTGKISHKNTTSDTPNIEDGYIRFGDNTLVYGKQSEQGDLYNTENDIFHKGNLVAGENIIITEQDGVYSINSEGSTEPSTNVLVDNETIVKNDKDIITTVGQKTVNDGVYYDWIGTKEEYNIAIDNNQIQSNWVCYITDDYDDNSDIIESEIELNNPFFLGMSEYFNVEPNNLSWLKSTGQWNTKSLYPDYYNWILVERNKEIKQLYFWGDSTITQGGWTLNETPQIGDIVYALTPKQKWGTITAVTSDSITFLTIENNSVTQTRETLGDTTDYIVIEGNPVVLLNTTNISSSSIISDDYVYRINTENETFRLPLLNGNEDLIGTQKVSYALPTISGQQYIANFNGIIQVQATTTAVNQFVQVMNKTTQVRNEDRCPITNGYIVESVEVKKGDTFQVTADVIANIISLDLYKAQGNGILYFYVGETVQNANLINAGEINESLTKKLDKSSVKAYITETYQSGTSGYRIWSDGWCEQWGFVPTGTAAKVQISFLREFLTTPHMNGAILSAATSSPGFSSIAIIDSNFSNTGFTIQRSASCSKFWQASGYIK